MREDAEPDVWRLSVTRPADVPLVAEEIARQVQRVIIDRDLPEGARLPSERDLARILETSRPTVSQAIRILVVRGLVESRRGSGAYVVRRPAATLAAAVTLMLELDRDSLAHLADLRLGLETMGIVQAIALAGEAETAAAEAALERLRASAGDTSDWVTADTDFHSTLVRGSHNPYLAAIFEGVHGALIYYEYRSWIDSGTAPRWIHPTRAADLIAVHEPIMQALRLGDVDAARVAVLGHNEAMTQHLAISGGPRSA